MPYNLFFPSLIVSCHSGFLTLLQIHQARLLPRAFALLLPLPKLLFSQIQACFPLFLQASTPLPRRPTLMSPLKTVPPSFLVSLLFHLSSLLLSLPALYFYLLLFLSPPLDFKFMRIRFCISGTQNGSVLGQLSWKWTVTCMQISCSLFPGAAPGREGGGRTGWREVWNCLVTTAESASSKLE